MKYRTLFALFVIVSLTFSCQQDQQSDSEDLSLPPEFKWEDNTITNLYDAFGEDRDGLVKDFGFSALVKYRGKLILFDAGTNADVLKQNVEALGVRLEEIDFAVASHAHGDHVNGFDYLLEVNPEVKIYLPSDFYLGTTLSLNLKGREIGVVDSLPEKMRYFGKSKGDMNATLVQSGRYWGANVEFIKDHTTIEEGITLITTVSPYMGYGSKYPSVNESGDENDEIQFSGLPELSLSLATDEGEVLIVGCSHSSVQNIITDTKSQTGNEIALLFGGYHMIPYGREELNHVADQLKSKFGVKRLAPAHCTGHLAFKILSDTYGQDYLFAGLGEQLKF